MLVCCLSSGRGIGASCSLGSVVLHLGIQVLERLLGLLGGTRSGRCTCGSSTTTSTTTCACSATLRTRLLRCVAWGLRVPGKLGVGLGLSGSYDGVNDDLDLEWLLCGKRGMRCQAMS